LQAIHLIADRLDGKTVQVIDSNDVPLEAMTEQQLMAIIRGGSPEPLDEPSYPFARPVSRTVPRSKDCATFGYWGSRARYAPPVRPQK
jgi:hypothetical protein